MQQVQYLHVPTRRLNDICPGLRRREVLALWPREISFEGYACQEAHEPNILSLTPSSVVPRRIRALSFMPTGFGCHHIGGSFPKCCAILTRDHVVGEMRPEVFSDVRSAPRMHGPAKKIGYPQLISVDTGRSIGRRRAGRRRKVEKTTNTNITKNGFGKKPPCEGRLRAR